MQTSTQQRIGLTAQGNLFAGNDTMRFRGVNLGPDGLCLVAPFPRNAGQFVRVQVALESGVWLDADGILEECVRHGGEWRWAIRFSRLDETQLRTLTGFIARQREALDAERAKRTAAGGPSAASQASSGGAATAATRSGGAAAPTPAAPVPPPSNAAPAPGASAPEDSAPKQTGVRVRDDAAPVAGNRQLKDLFKEALAEVGVRKR